MKSIITTLVFLFISFIGFSQTNDFTKLDSFFTILEENDRFFGSVAVYRGDEVLYRKAIGYADLEHNITNNTDTKFRIGSISKTFTATLVMKAVELGKISLDNSIDAYFPNIQNAKKITVNQLLNHRSGIANFTDANYFSWFTKPITRLALLDTIVHKGVDFEPDTDYAYSNSNYVLLTFMLERVFNQSFAELIDEHIVDPLNLKNTGYGGNINTAQNEARSYRMNSEWKIETEGDMSIPLGAGGIVSTPTDLCVFAKALFNGQLISKESLNLMKPAKEGDYGFALYDIPFNDMNGLGHGGNIDAFASNLTYFEEKNISVAVSCNGANYGVHDVGVAVMSEVFGQPYDIPSFDFVELSSEELDQYLGVYETADLPMDMTITKKENTLLLGLPGQSPGVLKAKGDHQFSITQYGVKIKFVPEENKMRFEQQGMAFELTLKGDSEPVEPVQSVAQKSEDLDKYLGTYTSDALPIDLTISKKENQLIGQGDGQPSFTLSAEGDHVYSNKDIGLTITFSPDENKIQFEQGGAAFEMVSRK